VLFDVLDVGAIHGLLLLILVNLFLMSPIWGKSGLFCLAMRCFGFVCDFIGFLNLLSLKSFFILKLFQSF
jgi:hypothetical protein